MKLFDLNADTPTGDRGALIQGVWGVQRGCSRGEAGRVRYMRPFHIHAAAASAAPGRGMRIQAQAS